MGRCHSRLVHLCTGLAFLALDMGYARAEAPKLIAFEVDPYVWVRDGKPAGASVEIAAELAKAAGLDPTVTILPSIRALKELDAGNRILIDLGRTAERDPKYIWIGEILSAATSFVTTSPRPFIDTLDSARAADSITVLSGTAASEFLKNNGFTNFEAVPYDILNARKLLGSRVTTWFTSTVVAKRYWGAVGGDPDKLRIGSPVFRFPLFIAASKDVPVEIIGKMQDRLAQMKASGEFDAISARPD